MNFRIRLVAAAIMAASPLFAVAQSASQALTREQVRNEMIQFESAGFNPAHQNPRSWVDDAQRASAKVAAARQSGNQTQVAENASSTTCTQ